MARDHRCLAVVGSAYLVQGIVAGLGAVLVGVLAQLGVPLETQVGILASGALPWLLKFVLALVLDLGPSWPLRVRGVVLSVVQAGVALGLWGLSQTWPAVSAAEPNATPLGLVWVALNFGVASQDTLVDGLALDTLSERRAATATLMGLGHMIGFGVGPLILNRKIASAGMAAGLALPAWWVAAITLAPALLLWLPGRPTQARARARPLDAREPRELGALAWLLVVFALLLFGAAATGAVGAEFLFGTLGWDLDRYTRLPLIAAVVGILGSLACGPLVERLGPARAAILTSAALGATWLVFAGLAPVWDHDATILGLATVEGSLQAALLVALHGLALLVASRSPAPTTTFVLAMAALNLPRVLAPLAAPGILAALGFAGLFAACGLGQILAGAGLWPFRELAARAAPKSD